MLEVRELSHSYGAKEVLHDIDLNVKEGQILAVMGSSGGGKTTLLKCMSGLLVPTRGEVLVDGISVRKQPELARMSLGLVFQYAALFDYLNVRENILFGVERRRRLSAREKDDIVAEMLAAVSLDESVATQMPDSLSGGMRKRVGLARALAMQPKVLLYDEPTSGLDPITAFSIDRLIVDTRDRLGVTSIVVSHDVNSVFRVADRVAFLDAGRLAFVGSRDEFETARVSGIDELVEKARAKNFSYIVREIPDQK
ncbi:MAG: ATP-binding cassette domain-containing protein [Chthonomonas sp.]|nr:ATP-binding cassette domain-containing protein [Chthonomonas sp.]